jgi:hypothetical protein
VVVPSQNSQRSLSIAPPRMGAAAALYFSRVSTRFRWLRQNPKYDPATAPNGARTLPPASTPSSVASDPNEATAHAPSPQAQAEHNAGRHPSVGRKRVALSAVCPASHAHEPRRQNSRGECSGHEQQLPADRFLCESENHTASSSDDVARCSHAEAPLEHAGARLRRQRVWARSRRDLRRSELSVRRQGAQERQSEDQQERAQTKHVRSLARSRSSDSSTGHRPRRTPILVLSPC